MAQIFDRSSNALARASLVLTGLIVIRPGGHAGPVAALALGDAAGPAPGPAGAFQPQAPRAGAGAAVPVLSRDGGEVELRRNPAYQDLHQLPRTDLDQRATAGAGANSWATGQSLVWTKVHDLPDFVYFSHEIHVNKGWAAPAATAAWTRCR
jgi:hypothetical protein